MPIPADATRCTPSELAAEPTPAIIDARWVLGAPSTYADYLAGHIPGAVWTDLDADFSDPPAAAGVGGRHPLPGAERLEATLRRWGIDAATRVVVYDAANSVAAARVWWVLRWFSLTHVCVLDGGLAEWLRQGRPLQIGPGHPRRPGTVALRPGGMPTLDAGSAARLAEQGLLLDSRAPERFRGDREPIDAVAGHIPGAVNLPAADLTEPDGTLCDAAQLRAMIGAHEKVGAYCGSGVTAAHTVWALSTTGVDASLYPGSWSDWITDSDRPIATGQ